MSHPNPPALPARYRDVAYVAAGAFGQVWRATLDDGRAVAVKVLGEELLGRPEAVWRFGAEYRRLAALTHPAFPAAVEEGLTADGRPFFAMAFLPGAPLGQAAPMPAAAARAALAALAGALAHLHGQGLVHGDLKADNALLAEDGAVALLDVGEARPIGQRAEALGGTLEYMAPEVLRQAEAAPAADWYALASLGYLLLAGATPFTAGPGGPAGLVRAQLFEAPAPLPPGEDPALAGAVMTLLDKDPARRLAHLPRFFEAVGLPAPRVGGPRLRGGVDLVRTETRRAWERLLVGEDVALVGEEGAGKSHALEVLRLQARLAGRPWLGAACTGAGDAPGALARALLRQALAAAQVAPGEAIAAWLGGRLPDAWLDLEPRARKVALQRELEAAWDQALCALPEPPFVGVDDWHLADEASREVVARWRARAAGWCFATSPAHAPEDVAPLLLPDWEPPELDELVEARLGQPAPAALREALAAAGVRRPGLADALLAHWVATGALAADGDGWAFTPDAAPGGADPWTRLWQERVTRLAPDSRALARLLAAAREAGPLPVGALGAATGLGAEALQAALDGLAPAGLLVATAEGVRLAAVPVAEALAAELPAADRARAFTILARGVLAGGTTDAALEAAPLPTLLAAAALATGSDDDELAVGVAAVAARRALEHFALDAAGRILDAARGRLTDAVPPARRQAIFFAGAEAERLADRTEAAIADYEHALALAEAEGDAAAAARAGLGLTKCLQLRGRYDDALARCRQAEAAALAAGLPAIAARAAVSGARIELFLGQGAAARDACARAVRLAAEGHAPAVRAAGLNLGGALLVAHDPAEGATALAMIREAVALAEGVGDVIGVAAALENQGNVHLSLGELPEARDAFARDAELCRRHGIPTEGLSADMNLALVLAELGECDQAIALADDVLARAEALGRAFIKAVTRAVRGQAAWRAGKPGEAATDLEAALAQARAIKNRFAEEYIRLYRLEAFVAAGDHDAALEEAEACEALVAANDHAEGRTKLRLLRAALACAQGAGATAAAAAAAYAAADDLVDPLTSSPNRAVAFQAALVRGRLLTARGATAEGRGWLGQAEAIARAWGAGWHLAAVHAALAQAADDADSAIAWAREALAAGQNPQAEAEARAVLAAHGRAPSEPPGMAGGGAAVVELPAMASWVAALLGATDERAVHERLLSGVIALARADRGYLLSYERGRLLEAVTLGVDYDAEVAQGFSTSITEEVLWTGQPLYLVDAQADATWKEAASIQALGLRTVVALPLGTPGTLFGVVYVDREAVEPVLDAADVQALRTLADVAASRVAALREAVAALVEIDFQRQLADVAIAMAAGDPGDRRARLLDAALAMTGAKRAFWLAPSGDAWTALAARGEGAVPFDPARVSRSVLARVAETGEPECLVESDQPEGWTPGQSVLALGLRMIWCLPVGAQMVYLDADRLDAPDPRGLLGRLTTLLGRLAPLV